MSENQQVSNSSAPTVSFRAVIICLLAACFYLYEFILQTSPGVITDELMRDLSIDAVGLSLVSSFYYYSYTPMQLSAGLLYDRYGPRILLTFAILWCAVGALFLSFAHIAWMAALARFAMGFGSAFAFIGSLVLIGRWLPPYYFATMTGVVETLSSVGAITGQTPLAIAVRQYGWRSCFVFLGSIGLVLAAIVWKLVRDNPVETGPRKKINIVQFTLAQIKQLISIPQNFVIAFYAFCSWAPVITLANLWGVPYLKVRYGLTTQVASEYCALIWVGVGIGCPLLGWFSERYQRRVIPLIMVALAGCFSTMAFYLPQLPLLGMAVALLGIGIAASGQSLTFAMVKELNTAETVGTALGLNNMATVMGGAFFPIIVGSLLRWHWNGTIVDNVPVYQLSDYQIALSALPAFYGVGLLVSTFMMRDTYTNHGVKS